MEEEKEVAEEKEGDEEEEEEGLHLITGAGTVDSQDLPIMHWEDLSQRIAELEKQEQERRERSKVSHADNSDEPRFSWRSHFSKDSVSYDSKHHFNGMLQTFVQTSEVAFINPLNILEQECHPVTSVKCPF